jgi:hypothetical protein
MENSFVTINVQESIKELQKFILIKTDNRDFRFEFTFDPNDGQFVISVRATFHLELITKEKQAINKVFKGKDITEAITKFITFFEEGGNGIITVSRDGYQLTAYFLLDLKEGWIVYNVKIGDRCWGSGKEHGE